VLPPESTIRSPLLPVLRHDEQVRTETPWGVWDPLTVPAVAALFDAAAPWWIGGGYALELAAGRSWREHGDIDVLLLRRDQHIGHAMLPGWELWAAEPPGTLRRWPAGETLPPAVHDIWCRSGPADPWRIQLMIDESDGPDWVSRRDPRVRRPLDSLGAVSNGVPYLVPDVQLYYKAKSPRPKDETDFDLVLPLLTADQRRWLETAITLAYGPHPWSARLTSGS
jgi:hypothetical protein